MEKQKVVNFGAIYGTDSNIRIPIPFRYKPREDNLIIVTGISLYKRIYFNKKKFRDEALSKLDSIMNCKTSKLK